MSERPRCKSGYSTACVLHREAARVTGCYNEDGSPALFTVTVKERDPVTRREIPLMTFTMSPVEVHWMNSLTHECRSEVEGLLTQEMIDWIQGHFRSWRQNRAE